MSNFFAKHRLRRGGAMPMTVLFVMITGVVTVTAIGLNSVRDNMVQRGVQKTQATALAETGVEVMYDRIVRSMASNSNPPTNMSRTSLSSSFDGRSKRLGQYWAEVVDARVERQTPAPGFANGSWLYKYSFRVKGFGEAPNGVRSETVATFTGERVLSADVGEQISIKWDEYPGAIQTSHVVTFVTDGSVSTRDPSGEDKEAHVVGNKGIVWLPRTHTKTSITQPDVIDVQGHLLVSSEPTSTYVNYSRGVSGLGNPNGTRNYQSWGPNFRRAASYTAVPNEVTPMGQPMRFADQNEVQAWITNWTNIARSGTQSTVSDIPSGARVVIETTAFVDASLFTVNSGAILVLKPGSDDPTRNVVYFTGAVRNLGAIVNCGVQMIVADHYEDSKTAIYELSANEPESEVFTSLREVYANASLISNSLFNDAITIESDQDSRYGLVYATRGGIVVTGSLEMNGILRSNPTQTVAGTSRHLNWRTGFNFNQDDVSPGVIIAPESSRPFSINYVREASEVSFPRMSVKPDLILDPFRASRLGNWTQLQ